MVVFRKWNLSFFFFCYLKFLSLERGSNFVYIILLAEVKEKKKCKTKRYLVISLTYFTYPYVVRIFACQNASLSRRKTEKKRHPFDEPRSRFIELSPNIFFLARTHVASNRSIRRIGLAIPSPVVVLPMALLQCRINRIPSTNFIAQYYIDTCEIRVEIAKSVEFLFCTRA